MPKVTHFGQVLQCWPKIGQRIRYCDGSLEGPWARSMHEATCPKCKATLARNLAYEKRENGKKKGEKTPCKSKKKSASR